MSVHKGHTSVGGSTLPKCKSNRERPKTKFTTSRDSDNGGDGAKLKMSEHLKRSEHGRLVRFVLPLAQKAAQQWCSSFFGRSVWQNCVVCLIDRISHRSLSVSMFL